MRCAAEFSLPAFYCCGVDDPRPVSISGAIFCLVWPAGIPSRGHPRACVCPASCPVECDGLGGPTGKFGPDTCHPTVVHEALLIADELCQHRNQQRVYRGLRTTGGCAARGRAAGTPAAAVVLGPHHCPRDGARSARRGCFQYLLQAHNSVGQSWHRCCRTPRVLSAISGLL